MIRPCDVDDGSVSYLNQMQKNDVLLPLPGNVVIETHRSFNERDKVT